MEWQDVHNQAFFQTDHGEFPNAVQPGRMTVSARSEMECWITEVNDAKLPYGFLAPSIDESKIEYENIHENN